MLTKGLAIAAYENGRLVPDRLTQRGRARYAGYAEEMLHVYRHGSGRTRRELHQAVHAVFESETPVPAPHRRLLQVARQRRHIRAGAAGMCRRLAPGDISAGRCHASAGPESRPLMPA